MPGAGGSASLTAGLTHETLAALNAAQTGGQTPFLIVPPSEPSSSSLRSASTEPLPQVHRLMPVRLTGSWQGECPLAARHSPSCRWHPPPPAPTSPQVWQDLFACTRSAQSDAFLDSLASRPPLPPPARLRPQGGQSSGSVAAVSARSGASGPVTEAGPATRPGSANSGPAARPEPPSAAAPPVGAPDAAAAAAAEEGAIARGVVLGTAADDIDPSLGISRDTLFEQYLSPEALVQRHRLGKPEVRRLYQALQVCWEGCMEYHSCHMALLLAHRDAVNALHASTPPSSPPAPLCTAPACPALPRCTAWRFTRRCWSAPPTPPTGACCCWRSGAALPCCGMRHCRQACWVLEGREASGCALAVKHLLKRAALASQSEACL